MLERIDRVNAEIARLTEVIQRLLAPWEEQMQQAGSMPGVDADGSAHGFDSAATIAGADALISQLLPLIQATEANVGELDRQRGFTSPYAALDAILSNARCLIFDFDGPICDLPGAMPAGTLGRLRRLVLADGAGAPADNGDPFDLLAAVAGHSPNLGAALDAELTSIELAAVAQATVPGYVHEALAALSTAPSRQ